MLQEKLYKKGSFKDIHENYKGLHLKFKIQHFSGGICLDVYVKLSIHSVKLKLTNNKILLPEVHDCIGYNDFKRGYMGQLPSDFDNTSK